MAEAANDPGSLALLHDLVEPAAVAWWPPAPGWYALAGILGALTLWGVVRRLRRYRSDRYRREALGALASLEASGGSRAERAAAAAVLVKRVALVAFPRQQVAALSGEAWTRFLVETSPLQPATDACSVLEQALYTGPEPSRDQLERIFAAARSWITHHRAGARSRGRRTRPPERKRRLETRGTPP